jgi:hypothetical protein
MWRAELRSSAKQRIRSTIERHIARKITTFNGPDCAVGLIVLSSTKAAAVEQADATVEDSLTARGITCPLGNFPVSQATSLSSLDPQANAHDFVELFYL